jgi:DNA-binding response OmpR family regulator
MLKGGENVELSATEFKVLKYFIEHENEVISRATLLDEVWGYDNFPTTRTVDNFMVRLRSKIENYPKLPRHILSVHGVGYKFVK